VTGPDPAGSIQSGPELTAGACGFSSLGGFFRTMSERFATRTALFAEGRSFSYADLYAGAMRCARGLLSTGIEPGDTIGVLMPNGFEWISAVYGSFLIGARPVLLSVFSSPPEQEAALSATGAVTLLMSPKVGRRDLLAGLRDLSLPVRSLAMLTANAGAVSESEVERRCAAVTADDDAVVLFTSGTSGAPKAVLHTHRAPLLQFDVWRRQLGLREDERIFSTYPFCWSSGFARLGANLLSGGALLTMAHFDPGQALTMMARLRATMVTQPGPHLDLRLVEHPEFDPDRLRSIERVSSKTLARALDLPGPWIQSNYGLTETFTLVTGTGTVPAYEDPPAGHLQRPQPGWTIKIIDQETGETVPRGTAGQIAVKGPSLMRGYLGRPAGDGFGADGFFLTPDLGQMDTDGNLYLLSRLDDLVRSAGVNVSTLEVERELGEFGAVRLAVVLGVPHPTLGSALVACVVPNAEPLTEDDVLSWLRPRLASYKLPRRVLFISTGDLSYTTSQKVRRGALRDLATDRLEQAGGWGRT
jgi:fatty-acyl-CoA synthase